MPSEYLSATVRKQLEKRIDAAMLSSILRHISRWEPEIRAYFLQFGETEGSTALELGGLTDSTIVDLTAEGSEVKTSVIPIHSIQGLQLIDKKGATEFYIRSAGTEDIRYFSVSDADRTRLRDFAAAVERAVSGK